MLLTNTPLSRSSRIIFSQWTLIFAVAFLVGSGDTTNQARAQSPTRPNAPAAPTMFPSVGSKDVCIDTPLRLSFKDAPIVGVGTIKVLDAADNSIVQTIDVATKTATETIGGAPNFNYLPIIVTGNEASISLPIGSLAYNKTYLVTVDGGAFTTNAGPCGGVDSAAGWKFTTKAGPPAAGTTNLTVAADGSGDFCTVQGAVDFVPVGNTTRTTILLRKGTYTGLVFFANKNALTITGEDRKQSIIAYANNAKFNPSSEHGYHRGVFLAANCNDLVISNLTMHNTTPRGGSQAEAIILNGKPTSRARIANVDLYSFQDTLQINGQAYIDNCYIEGDVDFMWGSGPCFFENCHCYATRSKAFYTQIRNPETNHGYVYHHCTLDGPDGVTGMYLSRIAPSRFAFSEVVLIDCVLGKAVGPVGWQLDSEKGATIPSTVPDLHFWESGSHDADGNPIDVSKRLAVSRQLKMPDDEESIRNYSTPSFVLGNNWDPAATPELAPTTAR